MIKKIITCLSIAGLSIISTTSCTSSSKKELSTSIYLRKDIAIKSDKVIIFPTMYLSSSNFIAENKNFKGTIIDAKLLASWSSNLANIKPIPVPRQVLNEIPGAWPSLNILVSMMDNSEDIKNNKNYSVIEKFVHNITKNMVIIMYLRFLSSLKMKMNIFHLIKFIKTLVFLIQKQCLGNGSPKTSTKTPLIYLFHTMLRSAKL